MEQSRKICAIPLFSRKQHIVSYPGPLFPEANRHTGNDLLYQNWDKVTFSTLNVIFGMKLSPTQRRKT